MLNASSRTPPQSTLQFPQDARTVVFLILEESAKAETIRAQIIASSQTQAPNFANTIPPLANIGNSLLCLRRKLEFLPDFYAESELGRAISTALTDLDKIQDSVSDDDDLARLVMKVSAEEALDTEQLRYLARTQDRYRRRLVIKGKHGATKRLQEIEARIRELQRQQRLDSQNEDDISFPLEDLKGVPDKTIQSWNSDGKVANGIVTLSIASCDHFDIIRFADDEEVRKSVDLDVSRPAAVTNVSLVQEVVVLRQEAAALRGDINHAEFRVRDQMAKTAANVDDFLSRFVDVVKPQGFIELNELKDYKRKHYESQGKVYDGAFYHWDRPYYYQEVRKKQPSHLGFEGSKDYFPLYHTTRRMLDMFEHLFHLRFQIMPKGFSTWHEDVVLFSVWGAETIGGEFQGYLYMDMIKRKDKPLGAANWIIEPSYILPDGTRHYPSTAILCSFPKPTANSPCLLDHQEVTNLFHELGHSIHALVSKTRYACFQGTDAPIDFSEGPSQMLEKFCWTRPFLETVGCHYSGITDSEDLLSQSAEETAARSKKLPAEIIDQLFASRTYMNSALFLLDQLQMAAFGLEIFSCKDPESAEKLDLVKIWNRMTKEIQLFDVPSDPAEQIVDSPVMERMFSDYDVGYYSYHYSRFWFTEVFETFFKDDVLNASKGLEYRRRILERSGKEDEMQVLKKFLGREPSFEAFQRTLFQNPT